MTNKDPYTKQIQNGISLYKKKHYLEAMEIFERLRNAYPDKAEPIFYYGVCLLAMGERIAALNHFLNASELDPENIKYLLQIAYCLDVSGQELMAINQYKKVLKIDGNNLAALSELGRLYGAQTNYKEAVDVLKKAVAIKPSNAANQSALAMSLSGINEYEQAIKHAKKAIKIEPNNSYCQYSLGLINLTHGRQEEAIKYFERAIELDPMDGMGYFNLVSAKKITPNDNILLKKMEVLLNKSLPTEKRQLLLFALGKAYDDLKYSDKAFNFISKANALVHSDFNQHALQKKIKETKKVFNSKFFNKYKITIHEKHTPIFIVGMPRSGSTLIDQILSSHSKVWSTGESPVLFDLIGDIEADNRGKGEYPYCMLKLTDDKISHYSKIYFNTFNYLGENITSFVDKNLFNFENLGLISAICPNARIINTIRHPLDTSLSCYMTGFASTESTWTHDLKYIGYYYRNYTELMNYWRKTIPIPILDVHYENVIADTESYTRKILEFCNLEWEDQCLEFYNTSRAVNTASNWQVRQPIYTSSVQRWVPYAKHLQPLILALGDLLEADYEKIESLGLRHGPRHSSPLNKISKLFK